MQILVSFVLLSLCFDLVPLAGNPQDSGGLCYISAHFWPPEKTTFGPTEGRTRWALPCSRNRPRAFVPWNTNSTHIG